MYRALLLILLFSVGISGAQTKQVTFRVSPFGAGTVDYTTGPYPEGTNLVVTASTNANFTFLKWLGDVPSSNETDNPLTILITSNTTLVEANFSIISIDVGQQFGASSTTVLTISQPVTLAHNDNVIRGDLSGVSNNINIFQVLRWTINGPVRAGTSIDGYRAVDTDGYIVSVIVIAGERGSQDAFFDINLFQPLNPITTAQTNILGSTIYTNQANRLTILGMPGEADENEIFQTVLPDVTNFVAGSFFSMDCDDDGKFLKDVTIQVKVRFENAAP